MVLHNVKVRNFYGDSALVNADVSQPMLLPDLHIENAEEYDFWDHVDYIIDLAEKKEYIWRWSRFGGQM